MHAYLSLRKSPYHSKFWFMIVYARIKALLSTMLSPALLKEKLGEAIVCLIRHEPTHETFIVKFTFSFDVFCKYVAHRFIGCEGTIHTLQGYTCVCHNLIWQQSLDCVEFWMKWYKCIPLKKNIEMGRVIQYISKSNSETRPRYTYVVHVYYHQDKTYTHLST